MKLVLKAIVPAEAVEDSTGVEISEADEETDTKKVSDKKQLPA
jgi:hypothetical protein